MPRVHLTADDRRNGCFERQYRMQKAALRKTDDDVAKDLGISRATLWKKRKDPVNKMNVKEFVSLAAAWPDEEILAFVRGK